MAKKKATKKTLRQLAISQAAAHHKDSRRLSIWDKLPEGERAEAMELIKEFAEGGPICEHYATKAALARFFVDQFDITSSHSGMRSAIQRKVDEYGG
mgnify:CR=1 FL=1